ncbi:MAG: hypothetical protein ACRELC_06785 [Gemmatimonadota bacterium]
MDAREGVGEAPDAALLARIRSLFEDGRILWKRFDSEVRRHGWHPFKPAHYETVLGALLPLRAPGLRFLELGSAMGVIAIMADLLGFEAYGIELDPDLVADARALADRYESEARFAAGSFLPAGYEWRGERGDERLGTVGVGEPAYAELGLALTDFNVLFAYPWYGESPMLRDLARRCGSPDATLLLHAHDRGVNAYRGGQPVAP